MFAILTPDLPLFIQFDIALGVMYSVTALIEVSGLQPGLPWLVLILSGFRYLVSVLLSPYDIAPTIVYYVANLHGPFQSRLLLVRLYSWASVFAALLVTAAELLRLSLHFVFQV